MFSPRAFISYLILGCLVIVMGAAGCSSRRTAGSAEQDSTLMTSVAPMAYFVERIAGERWTVEPLVPQGFSPEDYSPSAAQMAALSSSRAVFIAGDLPVETTWIRRVAGEVPSLEVIDTSTGLPPTGFDPHTWLCPADVRVIYRNICTALTKIDPARRQAYAERLETALRQADSLDQAVKDILQKAPVGAFVIVHPALTRFAAHYGLVQLAIEKDGKEPTPRSLEALIKEAKRRRVKVVLLQKEFPAATARSVARQTGARIIEIDPLSRQWPQQIIHIAQAIANG